MAIPLVSISIKAIAKAIGKKLLKIGAKKAAGTVAGKAIGASLGLSQAQLAGIASSELSVINVVRAKFVKSAAPKVAKSLGIKTKELNQLIKDLKIKETYKTAVKGRNYLKNVKKLIKNPKQEIKTLGKRRIYTEIDLNVSSTIDNVIDSSGEEKINVLIETNKRLLDLIQDTLNGFGLDLQLPSYLWGNAEQFDTQMLEDVKDMLSDDAKYDVEGYNYGFVIVVGELKGTGQKGGGSFLKAYEPDEYIQYITSLIEDGYSSETMGDLL